MKLLSLSILALVTSGLPSFSQSAGTSLSRGTTVATRTSILDSLEVPAFTPPAPAVEKKVPVMRVDSSITVPTENSRKLTILRGEASTLPDIPIAPKPILRAPRKLTAAELARIAEERRRRIQFNAEVYENGVSVIRWTHPDTAEPYEAICGFDINLLAGIGQFTSTGKIYQLSFIPPGVRPTSRRQFLKVPIPKPPQATPDTVTFIKGNSDDPIGPATATLLRDLIANEKIRLIEYQEKVTNYQKAAADWKKANPVLPRDEVIWFSPHRGSRYLANPTPEKEIAR